MIENNSFKLYEKLVKEDNYKYIFDITIIYQVNSTLEMEDIELEEKDFIILCNEVKRQYLKYDKELSDSLVIDCYDKMEKIKEKGNN